MLKFQIPKMRLTPAEKIIYNLTKMKILNLMNLLIADSQLTLARAALVGHWLLSAGHWSVIGANRSLHRKPSFNKRRLPSIQIWQTQNLAEKKYFSAGLKVIKFNFVWKLANNYMFPIYSNIKQPLVPISTYPSIQIRRRLRKWYFFQ